MNKHPPALRLRRIKDLHGRLPVLLPILSYYLLLPQNNQYSKFCESLPCFIYTHTYAWNNMLFSFVFNFIKSVKLYVIFFDLLFLLCILLPYDFFTTNQIGWKRSQVLEAHILPLRILIAFGLHSILLSLAFKAGNALVLADLHPSTTLRSHQAGMFTVTYFPAFMFLFDQFLSSLHISVWGKC